MKRREFILKSAVSSVGASILTIPTYGNFLYPSAVKFRLSLAQWSINRKIRNEGLDPFEFADYAKKWGFEGLEYVSTLYKKVWEKSTSKLEGVKEITKKLNEKSKYNGLVNCLIMVDAEGDIAVSNTEKQRQAIENHHKWIDAAAELGCHSIRLNLRGEINPILWKNASIEGLKKLSKYAAKQNINILVENHGGLSSNAHLLAEVIKGVDMENCGTLPDFGNFCVERNASGCVYQYDRYKGIKELVPYAKALSAKSYDFDQNGNETTIDFQKILQIAKNGGYKGWIGVEYEGSRLSEEQGILKTKALIEKIIANMN